VIIKNYVASARETIRLALSDLINRRQQDGSVSWIGKEASGPLEERVKKVIESHERGEVIGDMDGIFYVEDVENLILTHNKGNT
jgi:hypothetical protein